MYLSKLSRTHLAYQFIILTLVFLWIAQNELMIDKKYVILLGLVPVFLYQTITISWCSELLPESQRSCLGEVLFGTTRESGLDENHVNKEQTEKSQESKEPKKDPEIVQNAGESTQRSPPVENKQRTYKFRGWQRSPGRAHSPPSPFDATDAEKTFPRFTWVSEETKGSPELSKRYFFPYRQKRPEEWIDPNGLNKRPSCKIRPRVSNIDERDEEHQEQARRGDSGAARGSPKIKKSYTFPRRREEKKNDERMDYPVVGMPLIPNKEYLEEARKKTRRRRSASISHLKTEQELLNFRKHQEFSQSVEVSCPSRELNATKSSTKAKSGIFSYFSKTRKDGNSDSTKVGAVKKRIKNFLQSGETLKTTGSEGGRKKAGDNEGFTYYPGYSIFDSDPFESNESRKEQSETK